MDPRIEVAERVIRHGAELIHKSFHTSYTKREKSRSDFVTDIDESIEDLISKEIKSRFPDDAIFGEENGESAGTSGYMWIVDPLDGTNNFVKGIPQAGIQLAISKDGEVVYGIVLNPFVQQMYVVEKGKGAYVVDLRNDYRVKMQVSDNKLAKSMMVYDSSIAFGEASSKAVFNNFLGKVGWVRIFGVAVIDLPVVALGSADLLVSNVPKMVDIAAGCLLIEEAGGKVTDFEGKPWSIYSKNIVASNGTNHAEALAIIASAKA